MSDQAEPIGAEGVVEQADCDAYWAAHNAYEQRGSMAAYAVIARHRIAATRTPDPKAAGVEREADPNDRSYDMPPGVRDPSRKRPVTDRTWPECLDPNAGHNLRAVDAAPGGGVPVDLDAINRAEAYALSDNTTFEERDDIMVAVRLARSATPTAAPAPNVQALVEACKRLRFQVDFQRGYGSDDIRMSRSDGDAILAAIQAPAGEGATPPAGDRGQG